MAKPICVVYYNPYVMGGFDEKGTGLMVDINKAFEKRLPDYHVLAFPSTQSADGSCEDVRFEVFNAENMDTTSLEEFKKDILETLLVT